MYTAIDYVNFRGDIDFNISPVNIIDRMIFTCMGKPVFSGVIPANGPGIKFGDAYNAFLGTGDEQTEPGLLESPQIRKVLSAASLSDRFKNITVSNYERKIIDEKTEQFSALTVHGPDGIDYVTFRGTDDTLIGWKENCKLAIMDTVAAQIDAKIYLEKIAAASDKKIIVSGHSKGGNLAVFAAANADPLVQDRIEAVYSFDGPGFMEDFFKQTGYIRIMRKTTTLVPKASIVGMMMNHAGVLKVVDCSKDGIAAHDPFTWAITTREFEPCEQSIKSKSFFRAFNELVLDMSLAQREEFTNELFELLSSTGATQLNDLADLEPKQLLRMAKDFSHAKEIQHFIIALAGMSFKEAISLKMQ